MTIDINTYIVNRTFVQEWYLRNKNDISIGDSIGILAYSTMCPCIAIAFWIGEACNWHPDVIVSINSLIRFYNYEQIIGKPEGCPV